MIGQHVLGTCIVQRRVKQRERQAREQRDGLPIALGISDLDLLSDAECRVRNRHNLAAPSRPPS